MASHTALRSLAAALCALTILPSATAQCATAPALSSICNAKDSYVGATMTDVRLHEENAAIITNGHTPMGVFDLWAGVVEGRYDFVGKPDGFTEQFLLSNYRYADFSVHGYNQCASAIGVFPRYEIFCGTGPCLQMSVFTSMMNWTGAGWQIGPGRFFNHQADPVADPFEFPTYFDPPIVGRCVIDTASAGDSDYELNDFGVLAIELAEFTTREVETTIGKMDSLEAYEGKMGAAVFGRGRDGNILLPSTVAKGSLISEHTADLKVTEGLDLGLSMSDGAAGTETKTIAFYEPDSTVTSPKDASDPTVQVKFTFDQELDRIYYLYAFANNGSAVSAEASKGLGGYVIFMDNARGPKLSCAVPCKKTYVPSKAVSTCAAGEALFDVTYDASSNHQCAEINYCDLCTNTYETKLVEALPSQRNPSLGGSFTGGRRPAIQAWE